ncbi:MAG: EAL domain-containing protein [Candidatus Omnitrophica bacterium]|nr:EAL domain-containing protein [Candidatus Omnitrophota bacterium]
MDRYIPTKSMFIPFKIVAAYVVFGFIWVLGSDLLSGLIFGGSTVVTHFSILKGSFFILLTGLLLYFTIRRVMLRLLRSEARQRLLLDNMSEEVYVYEGLAADGLPGKFIEVNEEACRRLGYTREQFLNMRPSDIDDPSMVDGLHEAMKTLKAQGHVVWEGAHMTKDGRKIPVDISNRLFYMHGRQMILSVCIDITQRKRVQEELAKEHTLLRTLIDNIPDAIYVKDETGRKILTNRSDLEFMGGKDENEVLGKTDAEVYPSYLADQYVKDDMVVLNEGGSVINREEFVEDAAGVRRWLLTSKIPLKDNFGQVLGLVGIGRDITQRKLLENKLLVMAHYDSLTSLPSRALFLDKANISIAHAKRTSMFCAMLFVDLDHFKSINDTLGHSVGDELLKDTAIKLMECVRETDIMARWGGDEFVIMLNDLEDADMAQRTAERIREKFNAPRMVSGHDLFITASVGIAIFPHDGESMEELLKHADTAMYAAKNSGRNNFCFYDGVMNKKVVARMQMERGLRDAISKKEMVLYYQPIVRVSDGKVRGFEALLRWFKEGNGLIGPDQFIPVAEESGLIIPIGEWVLFEACAFNKKMMDAGYPGLIMSVNISVVQFRRKNIVDVIRMALEETGLPPACLEIEVTESVLIESFDAAIDILNAVRELGVQVSLDDFGTGYSSLVHLQRLPISNLKIDRMFIKEIAKDSEQNAMIPAIIDLAHKLNLRVVAEGVETTIQLDKLAGNQCDFFQGYLFSRPMPADQVLPFLKKLL